MSLEFSSQGLANAHVFYSADAVLYCEGGGGTRPEISRSFDQLYWGRAAAHNVQDRRIAVVPRGSKTQLLTIATRVAQSGIRTVGVAFDRDFELGFDSQSPFMLMTYGRALESDVLSRGGLRDALMAICPTPQTHSATAFALDNVLRFVRETRWITLVEHVFHANAVAYFTTGGYGQLFTSAKYPRLNRSQALKLFLNGRASLAISVPQMPHQVGWERRHINAKLLWIALHKAVRALSGRLHQTINIGIDELLGLMISRPIAAPEDAYEVARSDYYAWMFKRFRQWVG